mgnify:CR=1 FL=1
MPVENSGTTLLEAVLEKKQNCSLFTKKEATETTKWIEKQQKYLQDLIIVLENRQLAESMKCVVDYGKDPSDGKSDQYLLNARLIPLLS